MAISRKGLEIIVKANAAQAEKELGKFGKQIQKLAPQFKKMALIGTAAFAAIGVGVFKMTQQASDAQEIFNKFDVVFKDVGKQAQAVAMDLRNNFGLAESSAKDLLSSTGDMLTGFGLSGKAALDLADKTNKLAVDLASFTNYSGGAEGASKALTKALLGERESVKELGIAILEEDVKAKVISMEATGELTDETIRQKRAIATLEIAYSQSQNAIGDFARTQDGLANQQRVLKERFKELNETIGGVFIPILEKILEKITPIIEAKAKWISENEKLTKQLVLVTGGVTGLIAVVGILGLALPTILTGFKSIINLGQGVVRVMAAVKVGSLAAAGSLKGLALVIAALPVAIVLTIALVGFKLVMNQIKEYKRELDAQVDSESNLFDMRMDNINKFRELKASEDADVKRYGEAQLNMTRDLILVQDQGAKIDLDNSREQVQKAKEILEAKGKLYLVNGELVKSFGNAGSAGVAAMDEVAAATKKAKTEIEDLNEKLNDALVDQAKDSASFRQNVAEAFVAQEEKVEQLRQQWSQETDQEKKELLKSQLDREQEAFDKRKHLEEAYGNEIVNIRRFNAQTAFDQEIELLQSARIKQNVEHNTKIANLQRELNAKKTQVDEILIEENRLTTGTIKENKARETSFVATSNTIIAKANEVLVSVQKAFAGSVSIKSLTPVATTVSVGSSPSSSANITISENTFLDDNAAERMGDLIIDKLKLQGAI